MVGKVRTERQLMDDVEIRLGRIPFLIGREIDPTPYNIRNEEFFTMAFGYEI